MRVYSPSQTETYAHCGVKRQLSQAGWTDKVLTKRAVAAMIGKAMAVGLEGYHLCRMAGFKPEDGEFYGLALRSYNEEYYKFTSAGGVAGDVNTERVPGLLAKGIRYYIENDPIPADWKIIAVEKEFTDYGKARPDIICQLPDGELIPVDNKWKESLYVRNGETRDAARSKALMEFRLRWQMRHYIWMIRQHYQAFCSRYAIILGELTPRAVTLQLFDVTDAEMFKWQDSGEQYWREMEEIDGWKRAPKQAAVHESKYGPCEFEWACFQANLDPAMMRAKYIQIERGK